MWNENMVTCASWAVPAVRMALFEVVVWLFLKLWEAVLWLRWGGSASGPCCDSRSGGRDPGSLLGGCSYLSEVKAVVSP